MTRATLTALFLATLPAIASAQPAPKPHVLAPAAQDRRELRQDKAELRDDWRDLAWIDDLVKRFDAARARRDQRALRAIEDEVNRTLGRELREASREVQESRREAAHDRHEGPGERRDDRRDARDDRRDLSRLKALDREFDSLRGRMDNRSLARKRTLLVELRKIAAAELQEDRREQREDRRR
jgi:hypothetical protein